jgi:hypothetical protein
MVEVRRSEGGQEDDLLSQRPAKYRPHRPHRSQSADFQVFHAVGRNAMPMPLARDYIHPYKDAGGRPSHCRIRIYLSGDMRDAPVGCLLGVT